MGREGRARPVLAPALRALPSAGLIARAPMTGPKAVPVRGERGRRRPRSRRERGARGRSVPISPRFGRVIVWRGRLARPRRPGHPHLPDPSAQAPVPPRSSAFDASGEISGISGKRDKPCEKLTDHCQLPCGATRRRSATWKAARSRAGVQPPRPVKPTSPSARNWRENLRRLAVGDVRLICLGGLVFDPAMASF